jgi:hypothetical protein
MRWNQGMALVVGGSLALAAACGGGGGDDDARAAGPLGASGGAGGGGATTEPAGSGGSGSAGGGSGGSGGTPTKLPDDACAAVPQDQVEPLAPAARITGPAQGGSGGVAQATCSWNSDTTTLTLTYLGGIPPAQVRMSMEGEVADAQGEMTTVSGDEAGLWSSIPGNLEVAVIHGDVYVTVEYMQITGGPAAERRDDLMAVAEAAVGAL